MKTYATGPTYGIGRVLFGCSRVPSKIRAEVSGLLAGDAVAPCPSCTLCDSVVPSPSAERAQEGMPAHAGPGFAHEAPVAAPVWGGQAPEDWEDSDAHPVQPEDATSLERPWAAARENDQVWSTGQHDVGWLRRGEP